MDGLTLLALCREWNDTLTRARIDKIHQPADREIVLTARGRETTSRLFLSADRSQPRAYTLQLQRPANPDEPPMFCMMLRKRLEGGRILRFVQQGYDRAVEIHIESTNELGDLVSYALILEMMGKHSNLMLTELGADQRPSRIVDSIVHVSPDMSIRPVLPGFAYTPAPPQDKREPNQVTLDDIRGLELAGLSEKLQVRAMCGLIQGLGPVAAREVLARAGRMSHDGTSTPPSGSLSALFTDESVFGALQELVQGILGQTEPASLGLDNLGRPITAAPYRLTSHVSFQPVDSLNEAMELVLVETMQFRQTSKLAKEIETTVKTALDRLRGKLSKITELELSSHEHEALRIQGELLTTYAYQVKRGQAEVVLPNYYEDDKPLTIALDPALSAIENAQRLFKQSSKRKRSIPILKAERARTVADMDYLEHVLVYLQDADASQLEAIRVELEQQGFWKGSSRKKASRRAGDSVKRMRDQPDTYQSSDGFTIRVGRNNQQNDRLTLRSSQPTDVWLHVKDQPGSHVVIQADRREVPETTLHQAALLAAYYSRGRDSANVAVDYTHVKHVWKPNGARPGHVLYDHQRTLYVTPERSLVNEVRERRLDVTT